MKYIKVKVQELLAALKPSQFRKFKDAILSKEYKKNLDHIFKGEDRLYIPFTGDEIKVPSKIEDYLSSKGLEIADYKAGLAKNKDGKLAKIGKALSKDENNKELLDLFNTSRSGAKKDNLLIVISRHPYDIAGMSTGRGRDEPGDSKEGWGWSSCMNLRSGENRRYVTKDIKYGTIIAYLIDSNDKNINKPIARLLLKQYINIKDKNDTIVYPEEMVYGTDIKGFKEKVIEWIETFQVFKGIYKFNPKLYHDIGDVEIGEENNLIGIGDKKSKNNSIRKLYYDNHLDDKDAKNDKWWPIKKLYYKNNPEDKDSKYDESSIIREYYYDNNIEDKDAKEDDSFQIRYGYYANHPDDEQAKEDESSDIRMIYYKNHPDDPQARNDKAPYLRDLYYNNHPPNEEQRRSLKASSSEQFEEFLTDYLIAAIPSTDKEYFKCVSQYYGKKVISAIKQGDAMAKNMTGAKIVTEKSDNGNLIVRWSEGNNMVAILGVVSTSGKLRRSDLFDLNAWMNGIIDYLKQGYRVFTSPNSLSKPLFDKVVKRAEKEGLNVSVTSGGTVEFGNVKWENLMLESED